MWYILDEKESWNNDTLNLQLASVPARPQESIIKNGKIVIFGIFFY